MFDEADVELGLVLSLRYPPLRSWGKEVHRDWVRARVVVNGVEVAVPEMGRSSPLLVTDVSFPCEVVVNSYRRRVGQLGRIEVATPGLALIEVAPPHSSGLANTTGPIGVHLADFRLAALKPESTE